MRTITTIALFCIALSACNNESKSERLTSVDYSKLRPARGQATSLVPVQNSDALSNYIKNGIRLRLQPPVNDIFYTTAAQTMRDSQPIHSYSTLNVHQDGVGEPDYMAYDGSHLYIPSQTYYSEFPSIRILETSPSSATATEIKTIQADTEGNNRGVYLSKSNNKSRLISLAENFSYYPFQLDVSFAPNYNDSKTYLRIYNNQTPAETQLLKQYEIDGNLIQSRRIGNKIFLITQHYPNIPDINYTASTDKEEVTNELIIRNAKLSSLLPQYKINTGTSLPLVKPEDCLINPDIGRSEGLFSLVAISILDINTEEIESSICLSSLVEGIYMSTTSLYMGAHLWNDNFSSAGSIIHKLNLQDGAMNYINGIVIPGEIFSTDPGFRMNEYDGKLRVVSSEWESSKINNRLFIIEETNQSLRIIAQLPNSARPEPIGKPGEAVHAVRFHNDRGYIVTFLRRDPLYVLDLSNPYDPKTTAAMDISGFSTYLHPFNNQFLFSLGQEADVNGIAQGVKLELFDIRDEYFPLSVNKHRIGEQGSYSPVDHDMQSISLLQSTTDITRIAAPIRVILNGQWDHNGLYLFELNSNPNVPALVLKGKMITKQSTPQSPYSIFYWGLNRSVIHGDTIYYRYGDEIYTALWQTPEQINGPF